MKKNFNLIGKYLRGDASLEERIQVMKWAEGNDTQRDEFNALRRIYDATLLMDDDIAMSKRRTELRRYWKWLAAAAVVAFVAGISYLPENFRDDPTPVSRPKRCFPTVRSYGSIPDRNWKSASGPRANAG